VAEPWSYIHVIKLNDMNKKEIKNAITKEVCAFVTNLGYMIDDDGFHGSLTFSKPGTSIDDSIEWNRSYQESVCLNWASDDTKFDCGLIDKHMKPIIEHYNAQYTPKRAVA
jgi:hypothetical protein